MNIRLINCIDCNKKIKPTGCRQKRCKDCAIKKEKLKHAAFEKTDRRKSYLKDYYKTNKDIYAEHSATWRMNNSERHKQIRKEVTKRAMNYVNEYRRQHPCIACGEKEICCLEFHHKDPKKKEHQISDMRGCSIERIDNEIKKCVILCANCHAKLHAGHLTLALTTTVE